MSTISSYTHQLALRIQDRINELNISERHACLNSGLKPDAIRSIRHGHAPRITTILKLANTLQLSVADLMGVGLPNVAPLYTPDEYVWAKVVTDYPSIASPTGKFLLFPRLLLGDCRVASSFLLMFSGTCSEMLDLTPESSDISYGETVLVDPYQRTSGPLGLVAVREGAGIRIRQFDDALRAPLNPSRQQPSPTKLAGHARIIGQVLWISGGTATAPMPQRV